MADRSVKAIIPNNSNNSISDNQTFPFGIFTLSISLIIIVAIYGGAFNVLWLSSQRRNSPFLLREAQFFEKNREFAIILELNGYLSCLELGNEMATVPISVLVIVLHQ